jgi:hypothetical protein
VYNCGKVFANSYWCWKGFPWIVTDEYSVTCVTICQKAIYSKSFSVVVMYHAH